MIQVISRVFAILEELSLDGEVALDSLAGITGLNKGTLCNILRSLIELGYVRRSRGSHYVLTDRIRDLAVSEVFTAEEREMMRQTVRSLAEATGESGVLSMLRGDRVSVVEQAQHQQPLMVNAGAIYAALPLYHSVSGRILVAGLSAKQRILLCARNGFPGEDWDNIRSAAELEKACGKIRRAGLSIMKNPQQGIIAFAVPVHWHNGKTLSLGLTMPLMRCTPAMKKQIAAHLKKHAGELPDYALKHDFPCVEASKKV